MMKPFVAWLAVTCVIFGACGGAYHLYLTKNPRKILVAVDSSFQMKAVWPRIPDTLRLIEQQRYATFALITEKNRIHSWSPSLSLGVMIPYAPRDFSRLASTAAYPEIREANRKYVITTLLEASAQAQLRGWEIIQLAP